MASVGMPRLEFLGGAWLQLGTQRLRLERKTAGCLAYLALEGEQPRGTLAGLLWPEVVESRAKGNLRQCLYKLKQLANAVRGEEYLALNDLEVDVVALENRALLGDHAPLTLLRGELLQGYDFDDCPEFEDWLYRARQRWVSLRRSAFYQQLKLTVPLSERLELVRGWLEFEPLSEQVLRSLVSLLLEAGRPGEAQAAIEAFQERHRREYNEATSDLLGLLEQTQSTPGPAALLEAAKAAQQALRHAEATEFYLQAANAFAAQGEVSAECDALLEASQLMNKFDLGARFDALLERIAGVARTPEQVLGWRSELMNRFHERADWEGCQREARRVMRLANKLGDTRTALNAQGFIAETHMQLGLLEAAAREFETILETTKGIGDETLIHGALVNLAYARHCQNRGRECLQLMDEALEMVEALGDVTSQLVYLNDMTNYAKTLLKPSEVKLFAKRALALHQHISGQELHRITNLGYLGELHRNAGEYREALAMIRRALEIGIASNIPCAYLHRMNASVYLQLGAFAHAQTELERGFARSDATSSDLMALRAVQLRLRTWQGVGTLEDIDDLIAVWQMNSDPGFVRRFQFERSYYLHGQERVETVREVLGGIEGFAEFFLALAQLEAGDAEAALAISTALVERLKNFDPNDLYTPEILLTHARALSALGHPEAPAAWQNARDWVLEKAENHVPEEFLKAFLKEHPINRYILETVSVEPAFKVL